MSDADLGGDPACWAHLFEDEGHAEPPGPHRGNDALVVDLGSADLGSGGAIWSLPHGGDLDANLVRLGDGGAIGAHINDEVDVLVFVQSGSGRLTIDETSHDLRPDLLALIPRGARRSVEAGASGITYLSVHRRRGPLQLRRRDTTDASGSGQPE